jgi:hypothetical protein
MDMTRERVAAKFGITLRREIRLLGFPDSVGQEMESRQLVAAR